MKWSSSFDSPLGQQWLLEQRNLLCFEWDPVMSSHTFLLIATTENNTSRKNGRHVKQHTTSNYGNFFVNLTHLSLQTKKLSNLLTFPQNSTKFGHSLELLSVNIYQRFKSCQNYLKQWVIRAMKTNKRILCKFVSVTQNFNFHWQILDKILNYEKIPIGSSNLHKKCQFSTKFATFIQTKMSINNGFN